MESKQRHTTPPSYSERVHRMERYLPGPEFVVRATVTALLRFFAFEDRYTLLSSQSSPLEVHRSRIAIRSGALYFNEQIVGARYSCREHCCYIRTPFVGNVARLHRRIKTNVEYTDTCVTNIAINGMSPSLTIPYNVPNRFQPPIKTSASHREAITVCS